MNTSDKDWPEDAALENGNYYCRCNACGMTFVGLKSRTKCRRCSQVTQDYYEDLLHGDYDEQLCGGCGAIFIGNKSRSCCKLCHMSDKELGEANADAAVEAHKMNRPRPGAKMVYTGDGIEYIEDR